MTTTIKTPDKPAARGRLRRRRRAAAARGAVSLLEVVMVIAVMAVAAAIAVPRYGRSLSRYRVEAAARRVAADLELARSLARSGSASRTVDFSTAAASYQLAGVPSRDDPAADYVVRLSQEPYGATLVSAAFGSGVAQSGRVTFDRYGVPDAGGRVVVQQGDLRRTITLDPYSGKAVVE